MRLIYWSADLIAIYKPVKACLNSVAELEMKTESASWSLLGYKFQKMLELWRPSVGLCTPGLFPPDQYIL